MNFIDSGVNGNARFRFSNLTFNNGSTVITCVTVAEVNYVSKIKATYLNAKVS